MSLLRQLLDRLSTYLPLIVMALLASASWWLVRSVPTLMAPATQKPVRQEADYRLANFSAKTFDATGRLTREISGDKAQHYPATEDMHIAQVRIFAANEQGSTMNARAQQGVATDDGKKVTLTGDAVAIRPAFNSSPRIELKSDRMVALPEEDRVVSDDPVRIVRDRDVFTAASMDFNSNTGFYDLRGRVRGTLAPQSRALPQAKPPSKAPSKP
ncbi:MAG: hypothetical protein RIT44_681 [Pseudomonadota bacterium]|jgi:lipopolysaccharide export system protein LptC